jgi:elongation factor Ts
MADITLEDIQKLREETGAGVMDAKKALQDAGGDFDKAVALMAEKGAAKAEKRGDRATGAGLIETYVHNGRVGVMLEEEEGVSDE